MDWIIGVIITAVIVIGLLLVWLLWSKNSKKKIKVNKKLPKDNTKFRELLSRLNYLIRGEGKNPSEARLEILIELNKEAELERQKARERYERDCKLYQELEKQRRLEFDRSMNQAQEFINQLWLMIDVCRRELEIIKLSKGLTLMVSHEERKIITEKIKELNEVNGEVEKILKSARISSEMLKDIKKRLKLNGNGQE